MVGGTQVYYCTMNNYNSALLHKRFFSVLSTNVYAAYTLAAQMFADGLCWGNTAMKRLLCVY